MANSLNKVTTKSILDATVATADIAADAVTGAKIADDAVGSEHIEVLDAALQFGDSVKAQFGAGNDLEIYHDGQNRIRSTTTGQDLYIAAEEGEIYIQTDYGASNSIACLDNGGVNLYYDNDLHFATTSDGVKVLAGEGASAYLHIYCDEGDDNGDKWQFKNDKTAQNFALRNYASGSWETNIECNGNGNVELYYDNSKKLDTRSDGINVTGDIHPTGHIYMDAGYGIAFDPYGGSGANLLDDYEEGTWSPGGNWDDVVATYTKIGRVVHAAFQVRANATSGNLQITGLPFSAGNNEASRNGVFFGWNEWNSETHGQLTGNVDPGTATFYFYVMDGGGNTGTFGQLGDNKVIKGVLCYQT